MNLQESLAKAKMLLEVAKASGFTIIAGSGGLRFSELDSDVQSGKKTLTGALIRFDVRNIETKDGKKYAIASKVFQTEIGEISVSAEFPNTVSAETVQLRASQGKADSTGNDHWIKWSIVAPTVKTETKKTETKTEPA